MGSMRGFTSVPSTAKWSETVQIRSPGFSPLETTTWSRSPHAMETLRLRSF